MPITIHCPHDKTELELVRDDRTPEGLLRCPKCKCSFRVSLAIFNGDCYKRIYPQVKRDSEEVKVPKKRGRPRINVVESMAKSEAEEELAGTSLERKE